MPPREGRKAVEGWRVVEEEEDDDDDGLFEEDEEEVDDDDDDVTFSFCKGAERGVDGEREFVKETAVCCEREEGEAVVIFCEGCSANDGKDDSGVSVERVERVGKE